jgi:hypothetical protein
MFAAASAAYALSETEILAGILARVLSLETFGASGVLISLIAKGSIGTRLSRQCNSE